ncbi:WD40-repeat-containing domain protein [Helicostylum pulchrum]|nr:WD40-repeat-containing domain protein [Helicostylum pulchrum]
MSSKEDPVSSSPLNSDIEIEDLDISGSPAADIDQVLTDDLLASSDDQKKKKKRQPKKTLTKRKAPVKRTTQTKLKIGQVDSFNAGLVGALANEYPDKYWKFHADAEYDMIDLINHTHALESIPCNVSDQSAISSMTLSDDGALLATFSSIGSVKVWNVADNFELLRKIRDTEETQIDEFYCGAFTPNGLLAVGGKRKNRHHWSTEDNDNFILNCDIKLFDMVQAKVLTRLEGHTEEVLTIKAIEFKGENYLISTSQDGSIMKWHMSEDWTTLLDKKKMDDNLTCMAFTVSFLPNTGNKYFLAATDEHLRLYDFESAKLLQTFKDLYSSYCDCVKFVKWLDESKYLSQSGAMDTDQTGYAWFISRGTELCDVSDGVSSKPNSCTLHKLIYPTKDGEQFKIEEIRRFKNEGYHSNSWSVKIASNGRYLLAPTIYGQIFVFNMLSGEVTAIIKEHQDIEIRDVIFHPYKPLLFSCSDDGYVKVYTYKNNNSEIEQDLDVGMTDA